jgi:peptidoglycan/LPS O-acetylase OafA/YrhL
MGKRDALTKGLAIAGTVLIWIPLVLPFLFAFARYARARMFQVDYLMPAELFLIVAVGACLLLWAALRAGSRRKLIGWGIGIAIAALIASQALAVVTGLASGETEPAGVWWALVLGLYAVYLLALLLIGVGGVLLLRDLFKAPRSTGVSD